MAHDLLSNDHDATVLTLTEAGHPIGWVSIWHKAGNDQPMQKQLTPDKKDVVWVVMPQGTKEGMHPVLPPVPGAQLHKHSTDDELQHYLHKHQFDDPIKRVDLMKSKKFTSYMEKAYGADWLHRYSKLTPATGGTPNQQPKVPQAPPPPAPPVQAPHEIAASALNFPIGSSEHELLKHLHGTPSSIEDGIISFWKANKKNPQFKNFAKTINYAETVIDKAVAANVLTVSGGNDYGDQQLGFPAPTSATPPVPAHTPVIPDAADHEHLPTGPDPVAALPTTPPAPPPVPQVSPVSQVVASPSPAPTAVSAAAQSAQATPVVPAPTPAKPAPAIPVVVAPPAPPVQSPPVIVNVPVTGTPAAAPAVVPSVAVPIPVVAGPPAQVPVVSLPVAGTPAAAPPTVPVPTPTGAPAVAPSNVLPPIPTLTPTATSSPVPVAAPATVSVVPSTATTPALTPAVQDLLSATPSVFADAATLSKALQGRGIVISASDLAQLRDAKYDLKKAAKITGQSVDDLKAAYYGVLVLDNEVQKAAGKAGFNFNTPTRAAYNLLHLKSLGNKSGSVTPGDVQDVVAEFQAKGLITLLSAQEIEALSKAHFSAAATVPVAPVAAPSPQPPKKTSFNYYVYALNPSEHALLKSVMDMPQQQVHSTLGLSNLAQNDLRVQAFTLFRANHVGNHPTFTPAGQLDVFDGLKRSNPSASDTDISSAIHWIMSGLLSVPTPVVAPPPVSVAGPASTPNKPMPVSVFDPAKPAQAFGSLSLPAAFDYELSLLQSDLGFASGSTGQIALAALIAYDYDLPAAEKATLILAAQKPGSPGGSLMVQTVASIHKQIAPRTFSAVDLANLDAVLKDPKLQPEIDALILSKSSSGTLYGNMSYGNMLQGIRTGSVASVLAGLNVVSRKDLQNLVDELIALKPIAAQSPPIPSSLKKFTPADRQTLDMLLGSSGAVQLIRKIGVAKFDQDEITVAGLIDSLGRNYELAAQNYTHRQAEIESFLMKVLKFNKPLPAKIYSTITPTTPPSAIFPSTLIPTGFDATVADLLVQLGYAHPNRKPLVYGPIGLLLSAGILYGDPSDAADALVALGYPHQVVPLVVRIGNILAKIDVNNAPLNAAGLTDLRKNPPTSPQWNHFRKSVVGAASIWQEAGVIRTLDALEKNGGDAAALQKLNNTLPSPQSNLNNLALQHTLDLIDRISKTSVPTPQPVVVSTPPTPTGPAPTPTPTQYGPKTPVPTIPLVKLPTDADLLKMSAPTMIGDRARYEDATGNIFSARILPAAAVPSIQQPVLQKSASEVLFSKVATLTKRKNIPTGMLATGVSIQQLVTAPSAPAPKDLTKEQRIDVASEHVLDWLLSNHLNTPASMVNIGSGIVGKNKSGLFEHVLEDKLDTDYNPSGATYANDFWKAFADKSMDFNDFKALEQQIDRIQSLPDGEYVHHVADLVSKLPHQKDCGLSVAKTYRNLINRKHNLKADFEKFLGEQHKRRTGTDGSFSFATGWTSNGKPYQVATSTPAPQVVQVASVTTKRPLPTIAPDSELKFAGDARSLGGGFDKKFVVDAAGNRYLFKPAKSSDQLVKSAAGQMFAELAAKTLDFTVPVRVADIPNDSLGVGSVQPMLEVQTDLQRMHNWVTSLNPIQYTALLKERVMDWALANHDTKPENFLILKDGNLVGIDKEQALKWVGDDMQALTDLSYNPNGNTPPIYNELFRAFKDKKINLNPADMLPAIEAVERISDTDWLNSVTPYLDKLEADLTINRGASKAAIKRQDIQRKILDRKHNVRRDMINLLTPLLQARGDLPVGQQYQFPTPAPTAGTSAASAAAPTVTAVVPSVLDGASLSQVASKLGYSNVSVYYSALKVLCDHPKFDDAVLALQALNPKATPHQIETRLRKALRDMASAGISVRDTASAGVASTSPSVVVPVKFERHNDLPNIVGTLGLTGLDVVRNTTLSTPPPPPPIPAGLAAPAVGKMWDPVPKSLKEIYDAKIYKVKPNKDARGNDLPLTDPLRILKFQPGVMDETAVRELMSNLGVMLHQPNHKPTLVWESGNQVQCLVNEAELTVALANLGAKKHYVQIPIPALGGRNGLFTATPRKGQLKNKEATSNFAEMALIDNSKEIGYRKGFMCGGNTVESMTVKVNRQVDMKGDTFYRFECRLLENVWSKFAPSPKTEDFDYGVSTYDPTRDAFVISKAQSYDAKVQSCHVWEDQGSKIHLARPSGKHATASYQYGHVGKVFADVYPLPGETAQQAYARMLNKMDPNLATKVLRESTEQEKRNYLFTALLWARYPQEADNLHYSKKTEAHIRPLLESKGFTQADFDKLGFEWVDQDQLAPVLKGRGEALVQKHGLKQIGVGCSPEHVMSIIRSGGCGINTRLAFGIPHVANSGSGDITGGGSDYYYTATRRAEVNSYSSSGRYWPTRSTYGDMYVVYDTSELDRLDYYTYHQGICGKCSPLGNPDWQTRKAAEDDPKFGNEFGTHFRSGISTKKILKIVCESDYTRDVVIQKLKAGGITDVNGMTVDELVVSKEGMDDYNDPQAASHSFYKTHLEPAGY